MTSLLAAIRANPAALDYLLWPGDFDLNHYQHVEEVVLASGQLLEPVAKDGGGGTFFFCGESELGEARPVLYADSEGGAALMALDLRELVRLLLTVPWWRDCPNLTEEESAEAAEEYLEDEPDLLADRDAAARALGLDLPTEAEALARLREVATGPGRDYVLLNAEEGCAYSPLI
ncbi:hypothetical protein F7Q99_19345 [Streptomyces kaniharaensis]|uniref:Uncharacterized protein n=1 Tax=Streptomyces kaniharaensis TaxID=212423 RepID=A0A6N7KSF6_9ACTN|nr:hypothetical protein [Streptomyces kaniharaensis]MQS14361.1 hypothetical protein [Streptomyces kaniharaensis]